jgi:outer membrane autotransporter protein
MMKDKLSLAAALLVAMGVQCSGYAAEVVNGEFSAPLRADEYELDDNATITYIGSGKGLDRLFEGKNNDQLITGENINSISSDNQVFYVETKTNSPIVQTVNIKHVNKITAENSVFEVHGTTVNDPDKISKQIVNANIDEIVLTGNNSNIYSGDIVINNQGGIQEINGRIDKISISNPILSTGASSYGNAAIYTVSASTGNPDLDASSQNINAVIGQIGDADARFGGGIISQQGALQHVKYVGKIYAQKWGIATSMADIGNQTVDYVGDIDVYSTDSDASGIYNSSDTGNYDYIGSQKISVGNSIKADGVNGAVALYNAAGRQDIISLNHGGVDIWGKTYSVYIKPYVYNNTHTVDTRTTMKGNFNILNGDIKVLAPTRLNKPEPDNSSTLHFVQGDAYTAVDSVSGANIVKYDNTLVLDDDVNIILEAGNNDTKDNTRLILGDTSNPSDQGYNIVMGSNSKIDAQGSFLGNGTITYKLNQVGAGYEVSGNGVLLHKVNKANDNKNTVLNVKVGDIANNSDKFASTEEAFDVLKDAANHIFVEEGIENIGVSGQILENGKNNAGKVFLEEGLVHNYYANYFFDEADNVGTNAAMNEHGYKYQGDILAVKDKETSTMGSIDSAAMLNYFAWREEVETISQRLGEVRDLPKLDGEWIKVFASQTEYDEGNNYFRNNYRSVALGYDRKLKDSKWTLGGMFSYTDGESDLANGGEGDSWIATGAVYGTHLTDNGEYIDLIGKVSRMHTGFKSISDSGSMITNGNSSNWAYALSAEYGHRYEDEKGYFIDPQLQLTYGKINSADYTTDNGINIEQDAINSLIGRIGVAVGRKLDNGSYFARLDAKREFCGELTSKFSQSSGDSNIGRADMKDSWYELSVGGTCNFDKDTTGYFQVKRSFDADLQTKYRVDLGLRYTFN